MYAEQFSHLSIAFRFEWYLQENPVLIKNQIELDSIQQKAFYYLL